MIERTRDAQRIAYLSAQTGHQLEPDEAQDFIDDDRNICLLSEYGAGMFQWTGPDIYGGHIMMLHEGRGAHALQAGRAMLDYMRAQGAGLVWATVPVENRAARWFVRTLGFSSRGIEDGREGFWLETENG